MTEAAQRRAKPPADQIEGGACLSLSAGPSGVGKGHIINYARDRLAPAARIRLRPPHHYPDAGCTQRRPRHAVAGGVPGGARLGRLQLVWQAHGLSYALPRSIDADIAGGRVVIANISRQTIDDLRARYANFVLVVVSAHRDVIAERLRARGRETDEQIVARLERIAVEDTVRSDAIRLENSGRKSAPATVSSRCSKPPRADVETA